MARPPSPSTLVQGMLPSVPQAGGWCLLLSGVWWLYRWRLMSVAVLGLLLVGLHLTVTILNRTERLGSSDGTLRPRRWLGLASLVVGTALMVVVSGTAVYLNTAPHVGGEAVHHDSDQYWDGHFHNEEDTDTEVSVGEVLPNLARFFFSDDARVPAEALPTVPYANTPVNHSEISVTWFGHSSVLFRTADLTVLVDPVFGHDRLDPWGLGPEPFEFQHTYAVSDLPPIDHVLISHDHYDHLDMDTVKQLNDAVFHVPLGVAEHLRVWEVGDERIQTYDWWHGHNISSNLTLTMTPSQHFSGRGLFNHDTTLWGSWVLDFSGTMVYFSGDSGYFSGFAEIGARYGPFDLAVLEAGQYDPAWYDVHMFPDEVARAAVDLRASAILPVHNSKYQLALHAWDAPLTEVSAEAALLGPTVATPRVGQSFLMSEPMPTLRWWEDVPDAATPWLRQQGAVWGNMALFVAGLMARVKTDTQQMEGLRKRER